MDIVHLCYYTLILLWMMVVIFAYVFWIEFNDGCIDINSFYHMHMCDAPFNHNSIINDSKTTFYLTFASPFLFYNDKRGKIVLFYGNVDHGLII